MNAAVAMETFRRVGGAVWRVVFVGAVAIIAALPVYWMFTTALTPSSRLFTSTPDFLPDLGHAARMLAALGSTPLLLWLGNSTTIAVGTAALSVVLATGAGYAMSRFRFRGQGVFGLVLFMTQMLPEAMLVIPLYVLFIALGLLNGHLGLVLVNAVFVVPVLTWIIKGAVDSIPVELEEAARMDGCGRIAVLRMIVVPLIAPTLAACAVIAFFHGWNEFLFANTFLSTENLRPASVGIASFIGELTTPLDTVMSAALIYAFPAVVFFLAIQRLFVRGLTAGAVKG